MNGENELYELPKGWVWTTLGVIIDTSKGKKPKQLNGKNSKFNIPYITIQGFEHKIFKKYTNGIGCEYCNEKDILIVWDGARCGLVGKGVAGAVGSTIAKINTYDINRLYIYYFLRLNYNYINTNSKGVGIPHVDPNIFFKVPIPLPPLNEQQRIVSKIEELFTNLDAGISALTQLKKKLKNYRQSLLKYTFEGKLTEEWRKTHEAELEPASVLLEKIKEEQKKNGKEKKRIYRDNSIDDSKLYELPEGWVLVRIGEISKINMGQSPPGDSYNKKGIGIPLINGPVEFGPSPFSKTTKSKFTTNPKKLCKKGDLLICVRGSTTGRMNIAGFDACIGRGVASIRSFYNQSYLIYYIHSIEKLIFNLGTGSTFPNVTIGILNNLPIPLPPLLEQQQIVEILERQLSIIDELEKIIKINVKKAERLRQSILKNAFKGSLVPQDPTDEPAHLLLERIKAQKEKKNNRKSKKNKTDSNQTRLIDYDK